MEIEHVRNLKGAILDDPLIAVCGGIAGFAKTILLNRLQEDLRHED